MKTDDTYYVIQQAAEGLYKEKGSKFIAHAVPVFSEEDIKEQLNLLRKKYFDARHHCYAWVLGADKHLFRANDDGEPSGSAGKPILNQIYSAEVTNVLVVVVRYFGGIKLGVSGLVNAYKSAAREALDNAGKSERTVDALYEVDFTYPLMNEVMRILKEENLQPVKTNFELACSLELRCRKSEVNRVIERLHKIYGVSAKFVAEL